MDARYPFFVEQEVDWDAAKLELRSRAADAATTEEAADLIGQVFLEIGDPHNDIESTVSATPEAIAESDAMEATLVAELERLGVLGSNAGTDPTGVVSWAEIEPGVDYLLIERFAERS